MAHTRQAPELHTHVDGDHTNVSVDIDLPGVQAGDVHLRVRNDCLSLRAQGDDVQYETEYCFCCPVERRDMVASFEGGRLHLEVPFRPPLADARDVVLAGRVVRTRQTLEEVRERNLELLGTL